MNWYIGQEVIWVGPFGKQSDGPHKITGLKMKDCGCEVLITTTGSRTDETRPVICGKCKSPYGAPGYWRPECNYRPLISDSCIAELIAEREAVTK
jgi:hypothetical protein